jgi:two-component system NtrC family sensor kinase
MLRGLAPKLILSLTAIVLVVEGGFAWVNARIQERQLLAEQVLRADELSETIRSATWHAMLRDHRETAYEVMRTIGRQEGVGKVRFMNKQGKITFSTGPDAGHMVDITAEACDVCHAAGEPLVRVNAPSRVRHYRDEDGGRLLGMVTPIYNEPACSDAGCHAHPADRTVLGVLDLALPLDRVDDEVAGIRWRAALTAVVSGALLLVFAVFFTRRFVGRPVRELISATRQVAEMDLERPVVVHSRDELGELGGAFDLMRERLVGARREIQEFTRSLEEKVAERTKELAATRENLERAERLASLGRLCASVAHEVNNPLTGVLNFSRLLRRILTDEGVPAERRREFRDYLEQVIAEASRAGRIVTDLLVFSRGQRAVPAPGDLNQVVRQSIAALRPRLSDLGMEAVLDLDEGLPPVPVDGPRIQQLLANLVGNAAEAKPKSGRVRVATRLAEGGAVAVLTVEDDGQGIRPEHLSRVFEPFFTTKEVGQGTGLGLAVVYGIVETHGGRIDVRSTPGESTIFTVRLPVTPGGRVAR